MTLRYHQIDEAREEVQRIQHAYLRHYGWHYTSQTPTSHWLWRRDFKDVDEAKQRRDAFFNVDRRAQGKSERTVHVPYGVITVDTEMACQMTARVLEPPLTDEEIDALEG